MINSTPSLQLKAEAERERRRRQRERLARVQALPVADFIARTKIEVPVGDVTTTRVPFDLWPAQRDVLDRLIADRLIIFLKARQLGISWLTCGFVLQQCVTRPGQPWLLFSQGQLEANELTRRISLMYHEHADRAALPRATTDNTYEMEWENGSRVISLPATKRAGRSFTAAGVVLDEWAFMLWGREVLSAVKPVIDAGGKLFIISTADGNNTAYHQFWQSAKTDQSYTTIFLPWSARPDRGPTWRDQKISESNGDEIGVKREYPENDQEAFNAATGLVYDVWSDGPLDGNVTEAADYIPGGGPIIWGVDDGYVGTFDPKTQQYTADSHPRVILLMQQRSNGVLCVFDESYAVKTLAEEQINQVLERPYPRPEWAAVDSSAAELRGRLHTKNIGTMGATHRVKEGIKETRRRLAADSNGIRTLLVHPRCRHLRQEMVSYRYQAGSEEPVKAFDHAADSLRYVAWAVRGQ